MRDRLITVPGGRPVNVIGVAVESTDPPIKVLFDEIRMIPGRAKDPLTHERRKGARRRLASAPDRLPHARRGGGEWSRRILRPRPPVLTRQALKEHAPGGAGELREHDGPKERVSESDVPVFELNVGH